MLAPLTKKMTDRSTADEFCFSFYCDICKKEWRSKPLPFSGSLDAPLGNHDRVRDLIWIAEHNAAYERANHEAMHEHNHCPSCGKWVCDSCFYVKNTYITDICVDCLPGRH